MQCRLKPPPRLQPRPKRLGERRRTTIALGILTPDGLVIAADAQETAGYFKGFALKVHSAMTKTNIRSTVASAVCITGAGSGVYLDAITDEIIRGFHKNQDSDIPTFESHLRECVKQFYKEHVSNKPPHMARDIDLIVGAQIEGRHALWITDLSVVKSAVGFEAVGSGSPYARMAIENRTASMDSEHAAVLSVLGVMQAKEYDQDCGKSTSVTFLKNNLAHTVPRHLVQEAEGLFQRYAGIEYSAFVHALGSELADDPKRPRNLSRWLRELRKDFSELASRFAQVRD